MAEQQSRSFHHRSNFDDKRKTHKLNGKPSPATKAAGRVDPKSAASSSERKFRYCPPLQDNIGKVQRKAMAKERRKVHREKAIQNKLKYFCASGGGGSMQGGTPKIVVLVALSPTADTRSVKRSFAQHCRRNDDDDDSKTLLEEVDVDGAAAIECQATFGHKQQQQKSNYIVYECADRSDVYGTLDICKIADIILLVACAASSDAATVALEFDEQSKAFCALLKTVGGGQGTTIYGLYQSEWTSPKKRRSFQLEPAIRTRFLNFLHHEFGASNHGKSMRVFDSQDTPQIFRFMHDSKHYKDANALNCEWKQKRPHLLVQKVQHYDAQLAVLQVDGYLRGSLKLNLNRPVHIQGYGHFLVQQVDGLITNHASPRAAQPQQQQQPVKTADIDTSKTAEQQDFVGDIMDIESDNGNEQEDVDVTATTTTTTTMSGVDGEYDCITLARANADRQDSLQSLASLDGLASQFDQTIITEAELKEIEQERQTMRHRDQLKRQGLSDYDLEWNLMQRGDEEDDDDDDDDDGDDDVGDDVDDDDDLDIDADVNSKREQEQEEFEFRDEVDTPTNIRAKDRFAHYRGLKQFYKSKWDKFELLPAEYAQIANVKDWKQAVKLNKLATLVQQQQQEPHAQDGALVACGRKVRLYLSGVTADIYQRLSSQFAAQQQPLIVWSLLQYENKVSVCHYLMQRVLDYSAPIEALSTYTLDVGVRRVECKPVFSDNSNADKHMIRSFVHGSEFVVVSVYGYVTYPPVNAIMFDSQHNVCCVGNLLKVDAHRLLIKRQVLTGAVIRVQRKRAVVRDMFWDPEDVKYFQPIDLWTKRGLKGRIEESVGDKGLMKCFFNGHIQQCDTVCLSLYKRVFPQKDESLFAES